MQSRRVLLWLIASSFIPPIAAVTSMIEPHFSDPKVLPGNAHDQEDDWFHTQQPIPTLIPKPWLDQDIGSVGFPGDASYSWGVVTIDASGDQIGGQLDAFHFVYQSLAGDGDLTVLVSGLANTGDSAEAGLMLRASLDLAAANVSILVNPNGNTTFDARTSSGSDTSSTDGPITPIACWVRLTKAGASISGYVSPDGTSWTKIGMTNVNLGASPLIGLAVTAGNNAATTRAQLSHVTPSANLQPLNAPPSVTIISPSGGSTVTSPGSTAIDVFAIDSDGTIQNVQIYDGSQLLGQSSASRFQFAWNNPPVGSHILTAHATDNLGLTRISDPVAVTVAGNGGLILESPVFNSSGSFTFQFNGLTNTIYVIDGSIDLRSWTPISTNVASGSVVSFADPQPTARERFYRARVAP